MSDIEVVKSHSLPIAKAKTLAQKEVDALAGEYDLSSEWRGNTLHFHCSGLDGQMHVTDSEIRLHVTLGLLRRPFKGRLLDHIERTFDRLLPDRKPGVRAEKTASKTARSGEPGH